MYIYRRVFCHFKLPLKQPVVCAGVFLVTQGKPPTTSSHWQLSHVSRQVRILTIENKRHIVHQHVG